MSSEALRNGGHSSTASYSRAPVNDYGAAVEKKRTSPWVKWGIPIGILLVVGAVLGGVLGTQLNKKDKASSSSSGGNGNGGGNGSGGSGSSGSNAGTPTAGVFAVVSPKRVLIVSSNFSRLHIHSPQMHTSFPSIPQETRLLMSHRHSHRPPAPPQHGRPTLSHLPHLRLPNSAQIAPVSLRLRTSGRPCPS